MDQKEFKEKVIPLGTGMLRLASRILENSADARDCLQDAFLKLWNMRDKLNEYQSLEALSYTMVRNMAIDRIRKKKQMVTSRLESQASGFLHASHEFELENREAVHSITLIMKDLPEQQRVAVQLRDIEGLETEEILQIMNMNENSFRVTLSRARKSIREKLIRLNYGNEVHQGTSGQVL